LIVIVLIFGAAVMGVVYQNTAARRDLREHPMPGTLVDVGGYRMHIACMGNGSPTVVLDAGMGDSFNSWRKVQPQIAAFTQVCSYDRAGLGYSETSPFPRTSRVFAEELKRLLVNDRLPPPYILVGHSLGGSNIRVYANRDPSSIAAWF
jgi:pimeloyl-ACP methyl ester carboxylesterase